MAIAQVIGLGRSGVAAAKLLAHQGVSVTGIDGGAGEKLDALAQPLRGSGIRVHLGNNFDPDRAAENPDLMVVSPGVPWDLPMVARSRELGIETIGEIELAWRSLKHIPWIGITGTNGKTTTTALTAAMFEAGDRDAPACGNIGNAAAVLALEVLATGRKLDGVVAEMSSFQIESLKELRSQVGVWTTFTPDHLNRHHTLDNYFEIKASLLERVEIQIINGDDDNLRSRLGVTQRFPNALWTSVNGKEALPANPNRGVYIEDGWAIAQGEPIVPVQALKMVGEHNYQNLLMAIAAARGLGLGREAIAKAVEGFPGVPHRLEWVVSWQGVPFINDSKATNYDAAVVGLRSVGRPTSLIAGGKAKAGDDSVWMKEIGDRAAAVLLIGAAAETFAKRFVETGFDRYRWNLLQKLYLLYLKYDSSSH
ncbi:MAG: UDP-N-acetylmuramoyl-L-alanine--D-glutamate ligase, partial [Cyanophyceae cyanobacterium]